MAQITDLQQFTASVAEVDSKNQPVTGDNLTWTVDNGAVASVTPAADGYSAVIAGLADGTATYLKGGPFAPKVPDDLTGAFDLANVGRQYGSWLAALVRTRAPSIESQPANADLTARETLTLRAEIAGSPPLTYRWSFNGNPLADGDTVEGTTTEELRIVDADQTRTGSYTLEVTNAQGSITTEPAIVTIHQPPVLSRRPLTQLRALGDTATFSVAASDPAPLSYTCEHKGGIIPGASSATLNLPDLQLEDQGFYEVIVSNPSASISSVFHLRLSPPSSRRLRSASATLAKHVSACSTGACPRAACRDWSTAMPRWPACLMMRRPNRA